MKKIKYKYRWVGVVSEAELRAPAPSGDMRDPDTVPRVWRSLDGRIVIGTVAMRAGRPIAWVHIKPLGYPVLQAG